MVPVGRGRALVLEAIIAMQVQLAAQQYHPATQEPNDRQLLKHAHQDSITLDGMTEIVTFAQQATSVMRAIRTLSVWATAVHTRTTQFRAHGTSRWCLLATRSKTAVTQCLRFLAPRVVTTGARGQALKGAASNAVLVTRVPAQQ